MFSTLNFVRLELARSAPALLLAFVLASGVTSLQGAPAASDDAVTLNFVNADIDAVVRAVAEITGRNFVVDPKVKGTINIISARPVPKSLVYPTLLSALRMQGYAAVEGNGIVKIVPEADAKLQGGPVGAGSVTAGGDRLVTQVITLRYESATQLINVLRPLITPNNTIAAFPASNALVITDYAENLRRLDRIIASLDQPPAAEPTIIPVRYASALDLVPILNRLLVEPAAAGGAPGDVQQRVTLVADPRSNNILVRADNPGRVARVRQLIEQLDTPGRTGGNIFIIYLKNADAARVAQMLRALLQGGGDTTPTGSTGFSSPNVPSGTTATPTGTVPTTTTTPLQTSLGSTGGQATGSFAFSAGGATIQADTANNALIIAAPEPIYNNLRAIIERLDVRRAQVYVEALIVEVSADKMGEWGIQWQALSGVGRDNTQGVGGTNFGARGSGSNIIDAAVNLGSVGQGLNLGIIKGTINIPGLGTITNLAFLARALETQANANILSTPTLLTLDNEEARIVVGQNVPFITGQYTTPGTSGVVAPFQTIERKDVGLTLRVKPQIAEGGSVRLVIYQEVSRVENATNPAGIITNKRSVESSVIVDDGQIVALGGLIQDVLTDNADKVPIVGDMPVLGALFRYDTRKRTKTNLMVFLKPTVVRSPSTANAYTLDRYDYLKGEQEAFRPDERIMWHDPTYPQLPVPANTLPNIVAPLPSSSPPAVPPTVQPGATPPAATRP